MPLGKMIPIALAVWIGAAALPVVANADDKDNEQTPANPATAHELPQITVISNAPLSGLGLPLNYVPSNVQTADSKDLQRQHALDLADFLEQQLQRRQYQRKPGQSLSAGHQLFHGFFYRLAPAWHSRRLVRVYGRRGTGQRIIRRYGQLGLDSGIGDFHRHAAIRIESALRTQHIGRVPWSYRPKAGTTTPAPRSRPMAAHSAGAPSKPRRAEKSVNSTISSPAILRRGRLARSVAHPRLSSVRQGRMAERTKPIST